MTSEEYAKLYKERQQNKNPIKVCYWWCGTVWTTDIENTVLARFVPSKYQHRLTMEYVTQQDSLSQALDYDVNYFTDDTWVVDLNDGCTIQLSQLNIVDEDIIIMRLSGNVKVRDTLCDHWVTHRAVNKIKAEIPQEWTIT